MKPLYLTEKDYEKIKKNTCLGSGVTASVYAYHGYALKIFRKYDDYPENRIEQLIKANLDLKKIILPLRRVYFKKQDLFSYLMPRVYGEVLANVLNFDLLLYAKALIELNQDLIILAQNKIMIKDLHKRNILYQESINKASLYLIDPDDWEYCKDLSYQEVFKKNLATLMPCLKINLFSNIFFTNSDLNDLIAMIKQKNYDENYLPLYAKYLLTLKSTMSNFPYREMPKNNDLVLKRGV